MCIIVAQTLYRGEPEPRKRKTRHCINRDREGQDVSTRTELQIVIYMFTGISPGLILVIVNPCVEQTRSIGIHMNGAVQAGRKPGDEEHPVLVAGVSGIVTQGEGVWLSVRFGIDVGTEIGNVINDM